MRLARDIVRDFGRSAASETGVQQLAQCNERSAERDTHRLLAKRYKLSLPIPLSLLGSEPPLQHSVLRLRDWISFLVEKKFFSHFDGAPATGQS